ncbi:MAG: LCP family protein [Armatimonadota bacterium]|nr:LCP family protein [Armatimonadota bacterium]
MIGKQASNTNRKRGALAAVLIILGGAMLGVAGGLFVHTFLRQTHTSLAQAVAPPFEGRRQFRVLALGEDNTGTKRADVHGRSDTILVAAVDLDRNEIRAISIPRDTRSVIPGREGYNKINAAYALGGIELSRQTAEQLLGVTIEYYIKTNIDGLKRTVDVLGGVEIDIEKNMRYRDRRGGLYINLKKGYRHLNGDQALQYVRFRHDALGDISRIQRQQQFLRAVARRMMSTENFTKLPRVIDQIMSNVETNMSGKDLLHLARLSRKIQPDEVEMEMLPGTPRPIGGVSYMVGDPSETQAVVDRLLKFQPPAPVKPTVEVLNGSGIPGAAARVAEFLTRSGYTVLSTGNAPDFDYPRCEIQSHIKDDRAAQELGTLMNCISIKQKTEQSSAKADVTIVIGKDVDLEKYAPTNY